MSVLEALILAVVQGFTEFLPISSSAHLALAPWILGWKDQGLAFDIALHFGTLCAVLLYFFRDWVQITAQGFRLPYRPDPMLARNPHLLWWLAAATVPGGIAGLLFESKVETTLRNPWVIGFMLVTIGLVMAWADRAARLRKQIDTITFWDVLVIGTAQALAIVPGTSRSGITIVAALFRDLDRQTAARISFLLSTPIIAAASAKAFLDLYKQGGIPLGMGTPFAAGIAVSALTGLAVIAFFLRFLRTHSLRFFVIYRVVFGIMVIALAFIRASR